MIATKYLHELTNEDLLRFPVWEYIKTRYVEKGIPVSPLRDNIETLKSRLSNAMVFDTFYVKASFHTNNKRIFHGFCTVSNHTFKFEIQPYKPTIIQGKKHIPFWFGRHQPEEETIVGYFMHLRINPENLFPVTVHIEPDIFHIEKEGKIPGFSGIDDKMKDIIISSP